MTTILLASVNISLVILPITSVVLAMIAIFKILQIKKVQQALNSAIVLVPLYKKKSALLVASFLIISLMVLTVVVGVLFGLILESVCLLAGEVCVLAIVIALLSCKFAVLDNGVLLPYRFVPWSEFSDYVIEGEKIMFTGHNGAHTLSSASVRLSFNVADKAKLEKILSKSKNTNKN